MDVRPLQEKALVRDYLNKDRVMMAYALGDLEDDMWKISSFSGAFDENDQLSGVVLIWHGTQRPACILMAESDEAAAALLATIPDEIFCVTGTTVEHAIRQQFEITQIEYLWRMVVIPNEFVAGPHKPNLRQLNGQDAKAMTALMATAPAPFGRRFPANQEMLEQRIFFGIEDDHNEIVAVAGTHIFAPNERIGAVGFVFTRPDCQGRGFATATTGAVTQELFQRGVDTIVLNVLQHNDPAIHVYQKLGYRIAGPIFEGPANRIK